MIRGFKLGLQYFTDRGATEDPDTETESEDDDETEIEEETETESEDDDETEIEEDDDETEDLSEFTYEPYGAGYLLYAPDDHPRIGEKYFYNAWWMPKFDAWFFKEEFLEEFESMGATEYFNDEQIEEIIDDDEYTQEGGALSGFEYVRFGRGYLLYPPTWDHPDVGEKYFYNSWWMPKHNAWFFRSKFLNEFIDLGAVEGEF